MICRVLLYHPTPHAQDHFKQLLTVGQITEGKNRGKTNLLASWTSSELTIFPVRKCVRWPREGETPQFFSSPKESIPAAQNNLFIVVIRRSGATSTLCGGRERCHGPTPSLLWRRPSVKKEVFFWGGPPTYKASSSLSGRYPSECLGAKRFLDGGSSDVSKRIPTFLWCFVVCLGSWWGKAGFTG